MTMKRIGFIELSLQLSGSSCCAHYPVCRRVQKNKHRKEQSQPQCVVVTVAVSTISNKRDIGIIS